MNQAIFLDRDGVINKTIFRMGKERAPYSIEEFQFILGVQAAVAELRDAGFRIVVVTNQPDVARGWISREKVDEVNLFMVGQLPIDSLKACFHTQEDGCDCRKPKPGMLLMAAEELDINLRQSFMVGDRTSDVEAGLAAGCQTILVGKNSEGLGPPDAHLRCRDLSEAVPWILSRKIYST